jgi:hypothetical protein
MQQAMVRIVFVPATLPQTQTVIAWRATRACIMVLRVVIYAHHRFPIQMQSAMQDQTVMEPIPVNQIYSWQMQIPTIIASVFQAIMRQRRRVVSPVQVVM